TNELSDKLASLAEARTMYAKIDSELTQRTTQLAEAEQRLADAKASRSAALSTNLVAQLGPPQVSDNPIGLGTSKLTVGASMAGLVFGLGTVFLVAPGPTQSRGRRRWTDHLQGRGRRASDATPPTEGTARSTDQTPIAVSPAEERPATLGGTGSTDPPKRVPRRATERRPAEQPSRKETPKPPQRRDQEPGSRP
ncbi:MAG: hypothetical protein AAFU85_24375, partial [Planctomycetota bacterium]